jgi:hypothetical protein
MIAPFLMRLAIEARRTNLAAAPYRMITAGPIPAVRADQ